MTFDPKHLQCIWIAYTQLFSISRPGSQPLFLSRFYANLQQHTKNLSWDREGLFLHSQFHKRNSTSIIHSHDSLLWVQEGLSPHIITANCWDTSIAGLSAYTVAKSSTNSPSRPPQPLWSPPSDSNTLYNSKPNTLSHMIFLLNTYKELRYNACCDTSFNYWVLTFPPHILP